MALMDNDKTVHEIQTDDQLLEHYSEKEYEWGFVSDVESETLPPGLSEETVRFISAKKNEPEWMLEWRLKAFRHFLTLTEPTWPNVEYEKPRLQEISFYSAPTKKPSLDSLEDADPELLRTFEKLGIPLREQEILLNVRGAAEAHASGSPPPTPSSSAQTSDEEGASV